MTTRHQAPIKAVHADATSCSHRRGEPCPGREYRAVCKRAGCSFDMQRAIKAELEYVRATQLCEPRPGTTKASKKSPSGHSSSPAPEPVLPRDLAPRTRRLKSGELRLYCSSSICTSPLGDFRSRAAARTAFDEHCDAHHAPPTPLQQLRAAVDLEAHGDNAWSCMVSGVLYSVTRTVDGFAVSFGKGMVTATGRFSLDRARLCVAHLAGSLSRSEAEAARLELLREEKPAT